LQTAYREDFVIEKFIGFARELGHFPVKNALRIKKRRDQTFPSDNALINGIGGRSRQGLAKRVLDYCTGRVGYDDIIELCSPIAADAGDDAARDRSEPAEAVGFVYLMKSGRYYKIGRSNAAGRRQYELAIQMPEKLSTVHIIRTDDPAGIEEYWHRRFVDKRKNGEWFDLTTADVKAFKRRKFM
jgi:Meiotically up-regulated gene 113